MKIVILLIFRSLCWDYVHSIVFTTVFIFHHVIQHDQATGYIDKNSPTSIVSRQEEIQVEKPAPNNVKAYGWQKRGRFEVKKISYTYILLKGNHFMESKIIEYGIILLHKYKVEQTELIYRFLFSFLLTNFKNISSFF